MSSSIFLRSSARANIQRYSGDRRPLPPPLTTPVRSSSSIIVWISAGALRAIEARLSVSWFRRQAPGSIRICVRFLDGICPLICPDSHPGLAPFRPSIELEGGKGGSHYTLRRCLRTAVESEQGGMVCTYKVGAASGHGSKVYARYVISAALVTENEVAAATASGRASDILPYRTVLTSIR
jgi:hypothetical protein